MKKNRYIVSTICENCGDKNKYSVERSFSLGWVECYNCGCYKIALDNTEHTGEAIDINPNKGKVISNVKNKIH